MELALTTLDNFTPSELASFVQTCKASRNIALPILTSLSLQSLAEDFFHAAKEDSHQALVLLAPFIRQKIKANHMPFNTDEDEIEEAEKLEELDLEYRILLSACTTTCATALRILIGGEYTLIDDLEEYHPEDLPIEYTALYQAMANESPAVLKFLADAGAPLHDVTFYSWLRMPSHDPPTTKAYWVHHAAVAGLVGAVKFFLSEEFVDLGEGAGAVNRRDKGGYTPLLHAAENDNPDVVGVLLEHGADVNALDYSRRSALSWACECGYYETAAVLLGYGAAVDLVDRWGRSALSWAASSGHEVLVDLLLGAGADVETADKGGSTPLLLAAGWEQVGIVRMLLEAGAEVNCWDEDLETAMAIAKRYEMDEVVKVLGEYGGKTFLEVTIGPAMLGVLMWAVLGWVLYLTSV